VSARHTRPLLALRLALVAVVVAACATFQRGSSDPVGRYEFSSTEGEALSGTIDISGEPGDYTVVMATGGLMRDIRFEHVSAGGRHMTATTRTPSGAPVVLNLTFDGDRIAGDWAIGRRTGTLRGKRAEGR
jgi:hypothetical protein